MVTFDFFTKEGRRLHGSIPETCTGIGVAWFIFQVLAEAGLWIFILSFIFASTGYIGSQAVGAGGILTFFVCFLVVIALQKFKLFK